MAERIQDEHGDIGIEGCAVIGQALVLPMHRAGGRTQAAATGVFEALARLQNRLLADHARAFDLLCDAIGIVDVPAARDQLCGDVAAIGDGDGVGKAKHTHAGCRLLGQVLRANDDSKLWASHAAMVTRCRGVTRTGSIQTHSEFRAIRKLSMKMCATRCELPSEKPAQCGVAITLGSVHKGDAVGRGSWANTSR